MQLVPALTITTALTGSIIGPSFQFAANPGRDKPRNLTVQFVFTYGSGGTTADFWLQTSLDGGTTWIDIAQCHCLLASKKSIKNLSSLTPIGAALVTPGDAALGNDLIQDGIIGPLLRVKATTTGTYAGGTTIRVDVDGQSK